MSSIFIEQGPQSIRLDACDGELLIDALRRGRVALQAPCGGMGKCGKCRVTLLDGQGQRTVLACQTRVQGDLHLSIALPDEPGGLICTDAPASAAAFFPADGRSGYGVAVDLGTTTVAVQLLDLSSGRVLGETGAWNAQASYGADVITRTQYVMEHENGLDVLCGVIWRQIFEHVDALCRAHLPPGETIKELFLAGNTIMQHIACGLSPASIAAAPFAPQTLFLRQAPFDRQGVAVRCAPCVAGYVGGDIVAGLLCSGVSAREGRSLYLDIGTNGEMALGGRDGFLCCAVATGPAFEGAGISCGTASVQGAVAHVSWKQGAPLLDIVGGGPPKGICGSGLIDTLALLLDLGIVDGSGRLLPPDEAPFGFEDWLGEDDNGNGIFYLTRDHALFLSAGDVRALQLAKAAVAAGIHVLLQKAGISVGEVDTLYLAGGFGVHMNAQSAARIGLLPKELLAKVVCLGNASLSGARQALLQRKAEAALGRIAQSCTYLELSGNCAFNRAFPEHMIFDEEDAL